MANPDPAMRLFRLSSLFSILGSLGFAGAPAALVDRFPADGATGVNPDTRLVLTFAREPVLGSSGQIRIYDASDDRLVDVLDLSVPPGPTEPDRTPAPYAATPYDYTPAPVRATNANTRPGTPSGGAVPTPDTYQLTIVGGFTDGFHFHPVIVRGPVATLQLHHDLLEYNRSYYVEIDPGVLTVPESGFEGLTGRTAWTFATRPTPPPAGRNPLVVSADGAGDFNTVQGAIDHLPDVAAERRTIFVRNGTYEEIVYFRNKRGLTIRGESREGVRIRYANNEVFNPHPKNLATNEVAGTFPSRRAVFMADNCADLELVDLTIESINERPAQAEGLLLMGERMLVSGVTIVGSGDALQVNGPAYFVDCTIRGLGDTILGRGPAYFQGCEIVSTAGPHMWVRNTAANHGNVFVDCTFRTEGDFETVIARAPTNHGKDYPYAEAVLIDCRLEGVAPEGWGPVGPDTRQLRYWEFNSRRLEDGAPVDVSRRHPASRQLTLEHDAALLADYRRPAWVLGGWEPVPAPAVRPPTADPAKR